MRLGYDSKLQATLVEPLVKLCRDGGSTPPTSTKYKFDLTKYNLEGIILHVVSKIIN